MSSDEAVILKAGEYVIPAQRTWSPAGSAVEYPAASGAYVLERPAASLRCRVCKAAWVERYRVVPIMGEPGHERLIPLAGQCLSSPPHEGTAELR